MNFIQIKNLFWSKLINSLCLQFKAQYQVTYRLTCNLLMDNDDTKSSALHLFLFGLSFERPYWMTGLSFMKSTENRMSKFYTLV